MGFTVIPTSVGGASLNSVLSPLASLLTPSGGVQNLTYPSDLGSNPAMGHAVVIQAYDYTTQLEQQGTQAVNALTQTYNSAVSAVQQAAQADVSGAASSAGNALYNFVRGAVASSKTVGDFFLAPTYQRIKKGNPLTTVSMFMPDSLSVQYNSSYSEVSMTQELGRGGFIGQSISDQVNQKEWLQSVTPYAKSALIGGAVSHLSGSEVLGDVANQAFGQVSNPQVQLLYRGVDLRTFQLEFIMTPKSSAEAKTIKNICDSLTFYSLPGLAGGQEGNSGQFLTPPQLFSVQFKFLGQNGVIGNISNIISSALTNSGLGFLSSTPDITNGNPAKTFTVGDCVLENVSIDYTPNGWATYNDGYPVQTHLTLQFKETQMLTKQYFNGSSVADNYNSRQLQNQPVNDMDISTP
jgi:hypothetical protein